MYIVPLLLSDTTAVVHTRERNGILKFKYFSLYISGKMWETLYLPVKGN
jgi:hypothetical protein